MIALVSVRVVHRSSHIVALRDRQRTRVVKAVAEHIVSALRVAQRERYSDVFLPLLRFARSGAEIDFGEEVWDDYPVFFDNRDILAAVIDAAVKGERSFVIVDPY